MVLSMKRIMLAGLALAAAAPATAAERRYTVTDFDRVQVDGPFVVTLSTGKAGSAVATGDQQAIDRVSIEVQGRLLKVRPNRSAWSGFPGEEGGPLAIALTTHGLRGASVIGSGSLAIDKARAMRLDVAVSGSGRIAIGAVEADTLNLGLLGSGRIAIGGKTEKLRATVQGSGDLDAAGLVADDADIVADTAGTIAVTVNGPASVTATGPGDTSVLGTPACAVKSRGSGRVLCGSE